MNGKGPAHDLGVVKAAAERSKGIKLGYTKCVARLMGNHQDAVFDTMAECYRFARDVLLALTPADYFRTVPIPNDSLSAPVQGQVEDFDEYAVCLSGSILSRYGLTTQRTWYVKFVLRSGSPPVFCLSLHKLEKSANCVGGVVKPAW